MIGHNDLVAGFKDLGLQAGDTVLVHSSYKSFGGVEGGPPDVLEALLEVLTPEGTLIMPAFNFDFNKGQPWDVRTSPSQMGVITEIARTDPRFTRVFHPIYSFSIAGKHAGELTRVRYKSSYERISVFGRLRDLDGKIMVIGLAYNNSMTFFHHIEQMEGVDYRFIKQFTGEVTDENGNTWVDTFDMLVRDLDGKIMVIGLAYNNSMTFFHHIEQMEGVDYRFLKQFTGEVTDENGKTYTDTFEMLVRDIDRGVMTMVDPMGALMEQAGIVKIRKIGEAEVKLMKANEVYAFTAREMKRDPHLLYYIKKD